jgi:hypothetical protein
MSTILTRKGADYSLNARAFVPPVTNGLLGWWYLGSLGSDTVPQALARTTKNLAPGSAYTLSMVGAPTIASGHAQVGPADYFTTTIPEPDDFTVIALAIPVSVNGAIAGWPGASSGHDVLLAGNIVTLTTVIAYASRDNSGTPTAFTAGQLALGGGFTTHRVFSYKMVNSTLQTTLRDITGGTSNAPTPMSARARDGSRVFRIGGRNGLNGLNNVAMVAVYNRALNTTEEDSIRTFVAKYRLAKYGDVV